MSLAGAMRLSPEDSLRTFSEDENLPALPLPSLSHTLTRYLDSVRPFVSQSEFLKTEEIVKRFENGEGKMLHEKLKMHAEISRNWVSSWNISAALAAIIPFLLISMISSVFVG